MYRFSNVLPKVARPLGTSNFTIQTAHLKIETNRFSIHPINNSIKFSSIELKSIILKENYLAQQIRFKKTSKNKNVKNIFKFHF